MFHRKARDFIKDQEPSYRKIFPWKTLRFSHKGSIGCCLKTRKCLVEDQDVFSQKFGWSFMKDQEIFPKSIRRPSQKQNIHLRRLGGILTENQDIFLQKIQRSFLINGQIHRSFNRSRNSHRKRRSSLKKTRRSHRKSVGILIEDTEVFFNGQDVALQKISRVSG